MLLLAVMACNDPEPNHGAADDTSVVEPPDPPYDDTASSGDTGEEEIVGEWDDDLDKDGWSIGEGDCDDRDPSVHPGWDEVPGNGLDEDCDGSDAGPTRRLDDVATWSWQGKPRYQAGLGLAFAGDTNGDGMQEVFIGAPDEGGVDADYYQERGLLIDLHESSTSRGPRAIIDPEEYAAGGGDRLAGGLDLNGDGYDDVAYGMQASEGYFERDKEIFGGQVLVYFGPLSGTLTEFDADVRLQGATYGIQFGYAVSIVPGANGAGQGALLVGAPDSGGIGAAYLWMDLVAGNADNESADVTFYGESTDGRAGSYSRAGGDLTGDGIGDLLIPELLSGVVADDAGVVFVAEGPFDVDVVLAETCPALRGEGEDSYAGSDTAPAGDVDFDGYEDLLIGGHMDPEVGTRAGKAWLVRGPITASRSLFDADARFLPETDYEWFGRSVQGAGDLDGDGSLEVAIGAPRDFYYGLDLPGKVYLYSAPMEGTVLAGDAVLVLQGEGIGDYAGATLDGGRDIDLDGRPDLLVAAPLRDDVGNAAGEVYLLTGLDW